MLSWTLFFAIVSAAPAPVAKLGLSVTERCEMVLAVLEGAAQVPGSPVGCAEADHDKDGRQVALAYLATSTSDGEGLLPSVLSPTDLCRNRNFQVLGGRRLSQPHPKTMLNVRLEPGGNRSWLFRVSLSGFPTSSEGKIFLCGWTSGVVRRQNQKWVPRFDTK
jgi:hypothetical protein